MHQIHICEMALPAMPLRWLLEGRMGWFFEAEFGIVSHSYHYWCGVDRGRLSPGLPVQPTCEAQVWVWIYSLSSWQELWCCSVSFLEPLQQLGGLCGGIHVKFLIIQQ